MVAAYWQFVVYQGFHLSAQEKHPAKMPAVEPVGLKTFIKQLLLINSEYT